MKIVYNITFVFKGTACFILAVSRELMEQKPPVLQLAAASSALLTPQLCMASGFNIYCFIIVLSIDYD